MSDAATIAEVEVATGELEAMEEVSAEEVVAEVEAVEMINR